MQNIILKQFVPCETKPNIVYRKVNCKHWEVNGDCATRCKLKNKDVSIGDCKRCDVIDPIETLPQKLNERTHPLIRDMKEKLPQYNAFKVNGEPKTEEEKSFAEKAKSYASAEASQILQGKISQEAFEKRKATCMACEYRVAFAKEQKDEIGWCKGGCGCSVGNPRAALSQKLYMPTLSCPKGKFGPEKGEGFNVADAADSVKGIITSVKNLFEKDK